MFSCRCCSKYIHQWTHKIHDTGYMIDVTLHNIIIIVGRWQLRTVWVNVSCVLVLASLVLVPRPPRSILESFEHLSRFSQEGYIKRLKDQSLLDAGHLKHRVTSTSVRSCVIFRSRTLAKWIINFPLSAFKLRLSWVSSFLMFLLLLQRQFDNNKSFHECSCQWMLDHRVKWMTLNDPLKQVAFHIQTYTLTVELVRHYQPFIQLHDHNDDGG